MKYSIIIPTLNEEKLLPGLLNQLKALNHQFDYEIIISDGLSGDKTIELALPYADIIKVHNGPDKQNIAMGRNIGAKYASGEVLIFLNADIRFQAPHKFINHIEKVFHNSEYAAFTCFVKGFPEESNLRDKIFHAVSNIFFKLLNDLGDGMGRGECQVVRRSIFEQVGGYNEGMAAGEDLDLFRRVKKLGKIVFSHKVCVYESPRRYKKYGYLFISFSWIRNGLSVLVKNKSVSKHWEEVR